MCEQTNDNCDCFVLSYNVHPSPLAGLYEVHAFCKQLTNPVQPVHFMSLSTMHVYKVDGDSVHIN